MKKPSEQTRIRLEFTSFKDGRNVEWQLDKRLLALRFMLESGIGEDAVAVFDRWLHLMTDAPLRLGRVKKIIEGK